MITQQKEKTAFVEGIPRTTLQNSFFFRLGVILRKGIKPRIKKNISAGLLLWVLSFFPLISFTSDVIPICAFLFYSTV